MLVCVLVVVCVGVFGDGVFVVGVCAFCLLVCFVLLLVCVVCIGFGLT